MDGRVKLPLDPPLLVKDECGARRHPVSARSVNALRDGVRDRFEYEIACREYAQGLRAHPPVAEESETL